jgi:predicted DNA-binding transcriptional regulator YafY
VAKATLRRHQQSAGAVAYISSFSSLEAIKRKPLREVVHPYLLKQYNQRWFLVAQRERWAGGASVFALDRIQKLEEAPDRYKESELAPDTFFAHLLGVSILPYAQLQTIRLCFTKTRLPYVLTKPLRSSQEVEVTVKGPVIRLKLVLTRELITLLLSFGSDVEVIEPRNYENCCVMSSPEL